MGNAISQNGSKHKIEEYKHKDRRMPYRTEKLEITEEEKKLLHHHLL